MPCSTTTLNVQDGARLVPKELVQALLNVLQLCNVAGDDSTRIHHTPTLIRRGEVNACSSFTQVLSRTRLEKLAPISFRTLCCLMHIALAVLLEWGNTHWVGGSCSNRFTIEATAFAATGLAQHPSPSNH
eukprot:2148328-Amphidinium_carterae.5